MSEGTQDMESGFDRRDVTAALPSGHVWKRVLSAGFMVGALALVSVGLAPAALADDVRSKQWYLDAMSAQDLWKSSTGKGIKVAVVDTGVSATPSLQSKVQPGVDVTRLKGDATDDYEGHGTTMAELIAGSGRGGGLKGLAPDTEIIPIRLTLGQASKKSPDDSPAAIRAAADSDAQILSMSFGSDFSSPEEKAAVKYAESKGKLMFAGVGNDAERKNFIGYPAAYPGVVGVSAADETGKVAKGSEFGQYVDLAAPGLNIPHWCDATFRSYCDEGGGGTSSATAIASASAALIWSKHPDWTANQVLRVLIDTAGRDWPRDKPSDYLGYGLVRPAQNLLKDKGEPGPTDIDPVTNKKTAVSDSDDDGTTAPSASASAESTQPSRKGTSGDQQAAAEAKSSDDDGDNQLWLVLGGIAAVAVIGGGAFAAVRARRSA
ncbi:S8 family serine peptidase [Streptomyces sp. NPDC087300]|uniref:S8 family serine peptidase n=1 Tax=Streptomyces sp. NPDC087300 TaxID=3365780 RepID=UPI00382D6F09